MSSPHTTRIRHPQLLLAVILTAVTALVAVLLAAPQLLGLQRAVVVAQLIAFRAPLLIAVAAALLLTLILIAGTVAGRRVLPGVAVVLLVYTVAAGSILAARGLGDPVIPAEHATDELRVLSWNTRGDEPGSPTIAELAVELDADIVVLPETTEQLGVEIANQMAERGAPMWVHTRTIDEEYRATATTLLISPQLGDYVVVTDQGDTSTLPTVIAKPLGGGPTIIAAHPVAPTPLNMAAWRQDLQWLAEQCTGDVIVAGDFNATLDHMAGLAAERDDDFRTALGNCADGGLSTGNGAVGTWTAGIPAVLGTPIDHVMASDDWRFTGFAVITSQDTAGSDHRPVFAQLTRTDGATIEG